MSKQELIRSMLKYLALYIHSKKNIKQDLFSYIHTTIVLK